MPREGELTNSTASKSPLYLDANLQIIFGITLVGVMGVASITPAFPKVVRALGVSPRSVGLLISAFTLPGIVLTPLAGILADRYGRRRILVPSLLFFGVTGTLCWFAQDFHRLLILRFVQGCSAAALGALNNTLIGDIYSGRDRAVAMGYNASVLSIGTASYPVIGGLLAGIGWNYPFLLSPLAIPVGLLVLFSLNSPEPRNSQRLREYLGGVWGYVRHARALGLFSLSLLTFVVLFGTYLTHFPLLVAGVFDAPPAVIGLLMAVMSLTTAAAAAQAGRLRARFSVRNLHRVSFVFYAAALLLIPFTPKLWLLPLPIILFGVGHGINIPTTMTALAEMAPIEHRGAFMAVNGMVLFTGQTVGPIAMAAVSSLDGVKAPFYAAAALMGVMYGIATLVVYPGRESVRVQVPRTGA